MRLIAVTRIRNDEDIVEAFVQHHAGLVDHHIFLDNGSNGPTVQMLADLKAAGYPLSLFRAPTPVFAETAQNTFLLHRAADLGADWVMYLDCDEFADERMLGTTLRAHLAAVPANLLGLSVNLRNYVPTAEDNAAEPIVPKRLCFRDPAPVEQPKVVVRGMLGRLGATVERGNHSVTLHGQPVPMRAEPGLVLAHYPSRSGWQMLAKALVGRLKVLAAGPDEEARGTSVHYSGVLDFLRTHPEVLLQDRGYLEGRWSGDWLPPGLIRDPILYQGGALRLTGTSDAAAAAVRSLIGFLEDLAREHGRTIAQVPAVRALALAGATAFEPVF